MKYIFIVNEAAARRKAKKILSSIENSCQKNIQF